MTADEWIDGLEAAWLAQAEAEAEYAADMIAMTAELNWLS